MVHQCKEIFGNSKCEYEGLSYEEIEGGLKCLDLDKDESLPSHACELSF